jgi:hypothetical protein
MTTPKNNIYLNYKETLYFISKCLTISLEKSNRLEIEKLLQSKTIDWEAVVEVSTAHYVFPAVYCNLKRVDFLHYLPQELVNFMEHITNLNRERNQQIISQAKELNTLLLKNNITPIFLKGTGNLFAGIYDDIAERMVGDIDFLFSKEDYPNAITVLRENGYSEVNKSTYYFPVEKHYRRLQKDNNIAAIEIHRELLDVKKYIKEFNYSVVKKDCQVIDEACVLSYANKLNLTILSKQINDSGFHYKTIPLRSAYDVFLLSKKTSAKEAVISLDTLNHPLNCFLASCYEVFNSVDSLEYNNTKKTAAYLSDFNSQFANPKATHRKHKIIQIYLFLKHRLYIIYKSIIYKEYRVWLFKRVTDKNWYKEKLIKLGFK